MSTEWELPPRYQVVQVLRGPRYRNTVWDTTTGTMVPHPKGKRRAMSLREAFELADALNQHPATRAQSHG